MHRHLKLLTLLLAVLFVLPAPASDTDPTRPPVEARETAEDDDDNGAELPELVVKSVMYRRGGDSKALINGERYQVGDKINEWQVWSIESNRVILERQGEAVLLSVFAAPERAMLKDIQ